MSAQLSRDDWKGRVGGLSYRNQAFIGGKFTPSLTGKTFDCVNPATGQVLTKVAACEQADVDAAVKAARAAFEKGTWANMAPAQRKRIMLKLAELMMKNREELALLETLDMGKPIAFSTTVDIPGSANTVQWFAEAIDKIYDEVAPTPGNVVALITREASGVVACFSSRAPNTRVCGSESSSSSGRSTMPGRYRRVRRQPVRSPTTLAVVFVV